MSDLLPDTEMGEDVAEDVVRVHGLRKRYKQEGVHLGIDQELPRFI